MTKLSINLLNHASVLFEMGDTKLLTDPWYCDTVFMNGWGLRYNNPDAIEVAARATHLWISHPHSDHFHDKTLDMLARKSPHVQVLANTAYNYDIQPILQKLGLTDVQPLHEQTPVKLSTDCEVSRIGSGIIDSMMVIHYCGWTILNLNDCVLQPYALASLARELGEIDILLCNFNHAGKLFHYPEKPAEIVKLSLIEHFSNTVAILKPTYVVPFASCHWYLSPFSSDQNNSLLRPEELECAAAKILSVYPGQSLNFTDKNHVEISGKKSEDTFFTNIEVKKSEEEVESAILLFEKRLHGNFSILVFLLPNIHLHLEDVRKDFVIKRGRVIEQKNSVTQHLTTTLPKMLGWFGSPFGTDVFVTGAHFKICSPCILRLKFFFSLLLLAEAKISPRWILDRRLYIFLWSRRRVILGMILRGRVSSSYQS